MQRRLSGLLLIIRALAPFLMVLALYWGYSRIAADIQAALAPMQKIDSEVAALGETIDSARQQFDSAREDVEAAVAQVQSFSVPDFLPDLPNNLNVQQRAQRPTSKKNLQCFIILVAS
jgi:DNA anti-recombination protein RmuC